MNRKQTYMIEKLPHLLCAVIAQRCPYPPLWAAPSELFVVAPPVCRASGASRDSRGRESAEEAVIRNRPKKPALQLYHRHETGRRGDKTPADQRIIAASATVFARPDATSFDWARIRRGIRVTTTGRRQAGFTQISYVEHDQMPDPNYVTLQITGWVRNEL